jgi:lysophospholipase L1-like esterase
MLIDSGYYRRVVLISTAVGATTVQDWSEGKCRARLQERLEMIARHRIKITHVVWHQGESDNLKNTPKELYKVRLKEVLDCIRQAGVKTPFRVCVASYHPNMIGVKENGIDTCIRQAQIEFIRETDGVCPGPDTDLINLATDRHDGVHFSRTGLDKFALELYLAMTKQPAN